jgi:hypothetical protein
MPCTHNLDAASKLMAEAHASLAIEFATTVPFQLLGIKFERIGFGSMPTMVVRMYAKNAKDVVLVARQYLMREMALVGIRPETVEFTPSVSVPSRKSRFTDTNSRSKSKGHNKMGYLLEWHFVIADKSKIRLAEKMFG